MGSPDDDGVGAAPSTQSRASEHSGAPEHEQQQGRMEAAVTTGEGVESGTARSARAAPPLSVDGPGPNGVVENGNKAGVEESKASGTLDDKTQPVEAMDLVDGSTSLSPEEQVAQQEAIAVEEQHGDVSFKLCKNDGEPDNMERLLALKNIFAKQLPKMPKEYIVRLVFDRRHRSVALCRGEHVIGGICYRPYFEQKFSEIAFCAITATEQVKGYGTRLMNHVKEQAKSEGILYFLTYADNYAIGYFRKQGFSKNLTMPKSQWTGFIKDYDGAHLMECYIHPTINYLDVPSILQRQRDFILSRIRQISKSHVVYPGLSAENFEPGKRIKNPLDLPGVREGGWAGTFQAQNALFSQGQRDPERERHSLQNFLTNTFKEVQSHRSSWPFHEPVDTNDVTDYLNVITDPIDLSLIETRLKEGDYYRSKEMLQADLLRMCKNCKTYNQSHTPFFHAGHELEQYIRSLFKRAEGTVFLR